MTNDLVTRQTVNDTMTGYSTGTGNELTNDGTWTYTYDHNGDVIEQSEGPSSTTWYYGYNDLNQMVSTKEEASPGGTLLQQGTYVYDVFGNLIEEDVYNGSSTTVSRYVRDGWNPGNAIPVGDENYDIYATLNGSNSLETTYMQGDGTDQTLSRISSGGVAAWYWDDQLGTANFLTDGSGNVQDQRTYDAFGDPLSETNPSFSDWNGFAGVYTDNLTHFQITARTYSSSDGRFFGPDPAVATPNNLYGYTGNNPTNATDPSGLDELQGGEPIGVYSVKPPPVPGHLVGYVPELHGTEFRYAWFRYRPRPGSSPEIQFLDGFLDGLGDGVVGFVEGIRHLLTTNPAQTVADLYNFTKLLRKEARNGDFVKVAEMLLPGFKEVINPNTSPYRVGYITGKWTAEYGMGLLTGAALGKLLNLLKEVSAELFAGGNPLEVLANARKKLKGIVEAERGTPGIHAPEPALETPSATFTAEQLEKKWKHAPDFGVTSPKRNPTTLAQYEQALKNHLGDAATVEKGTYLYVKYSKVYFNPNTNIVVVLDKDGGFVTGFKLAPGTPQYEKFIKDGVLR